MTWIVGAIAGAAVYWSAGSFVGRGIGGNVVTDVNFEKSDLQFYRRVVSGVHEGRNYYDVARELIPEYYPLYGSVFNWRLPTYAYILGWLGSDAVIRGVLLALIGVALWLNFRAELLAQNVWPALVTTVLLFVVLCWVVGDAIYTQELWAATLLAISLGAWGTQQYWMSVVAGCAALLFRELMLPFPVVAAFVSWRAARQRVAIGWIIGIALFFVYLWWHRGQVQLQLSLMEPSPTGGGIAQWLQWGGVNFLLLTGRLTGLFLYQLPGGIVYLSMWLALLGLIAMPGDRGRLMRLTTLLFWSAFLIIGEPHNLYWGLLYAPMIPAAWSWGVAALSELTNKSKSRGN